MKKRQFWLCLALVFLIISVILTALLEPTGILRGFVAGDDFYRDRPTRYWREVLRKEGQRGTISREIARQFWNNHAAFPVLRECAHDADRNVRWPAIALLGHGDARSEQILSVLTSALEDEDMEVRLKAISALDHWGSMACSAVPTLITRLQDSEMQVAHFADIALWDIDQSAAVAACGWRSFTSADWKFTVMLPGEPEHTVKPLPFDIPGVLHSFVIWHQAGPYTAPTLYTIAIAEYPAELLEGKSKADMLAMSRDVAVAGLGGKLVGEQAIEQHGRKGMEHRIEVEGKGTLRTRLFWSGRRLYQVHVAGKPQFLNVRAADYFMESFRLQDGPPERAP